MSCLEAEFLTIDAPAKLNLFLKVLGKREDGFHEIETVMQLIDLHDTLIFHKRTDSKIKLKVRQISPFSTEDIPTDEKNLVIKAAHLLCRQTDNQQGVDITLVKRIPSQAGLGGGSSDAAATLNGLNELWSLNLSKTKLCEMGSEIGSDIPFFVSGNAVGICTGRGETIQKLASQKMFYVVVKPDSGLSTAEVYANCAASTFSQSAKDSIKGLHKANMSSVKSSLFKNSLEEPARALNPEVHRLLECLGQQPFLTTMMSGSGSACFGLCRTRRQSICLAQKIRGLAIGKVYVAQSRV